MKKIMITGVAGFIGFHLARQLQALGHKVIGCDNFNDYYDPQLKQARAHELGKIHVNVIKGDIGDLHFLQTLIEQQKVTHIVNLAAQAGVRYSLINPQAYIKTNIEGFLNVLEICRKRVDIPLIYASSSSVYGLNEKVPFSIEDPTDQQASLYGVTKKANELMANTYSQQFGISAVGLRFFTVYGPWGRPDMAYFSFLKAILEGKSIDVYNYGKMLRDFTYVDDIVDGIVSAIEFASEPNEKGRHSLFNLGNSHPEPLSALIEAIEEVTNKKAILNFLPMQLGDVEITYADIVSSQIKLNFSPKVSLKNGILSFYNWYQNYAMH